MIGESYGEYGSDGLCYPGPSRLLKNPGTDRTDVKGEKIAGVQYRKQPGRWRWCADDMNHR